MRSSRLSKTKSTTNMLQPKAQAQAQAQAQQRALTSNLTSPPLGRRQTRSSTSLFKKLKENHSNPFAEFAYQGDRDHATTTSDSVEPEPEPDDNIGKSRTDYGYGYDYDSDDGSSSLSSVRTVDDIEDILEFEPPSAKRQKTKNISTASNATAKRNTTVASKNNNVSNKSKTRNNKEPARRIGVSVSAGRRPGKNETAASTSPPPNWEVIYNTVKKMRIENPTAPVDTVGCAELYWRGSSARDRRFHTLTALMLSSQTKDTTTALAMHRLHTELGDGNNGNKADESGNGKNNDKKEKEEKEEEEEKGKDNITPRKDSTLNLENILAVSPERLNELIHVVGFHNNKTKYIKSAALILRDKYDSDIPSTADELMKLPGVGPKMAYLCMSAAWDKHEGIGVDVHVHRITNLWGWNKTKTPEETRMALQSWLPKDKWHEINKLLVGLGQTVCLPVGRRCGDCDLAGTKLCKSEIRGADKASPRQKQKGKG